MKKNMICVLLGLMIMISSRNVSAMILTDNGKVFGATNTHSYGDNGDSVTYVTSSTGEKLKFVGHFEDYNNAYIKLMSKDGTKDYLSFPVAKFVNSRISVKEVQGNSPGMKFWIVKSEHGVSDSTCDGFWLIGPYQNKYVSYVKLDDLKNAGLEGYEVSTKCSDGYLQVQGWVRNRGEELRRTGQMDSWKSTLLLFWDDDKKWFGISKN